MLSCARSGVGERGESFNVTSVTCSKQIRNVTLHRRRPCYGKEGSEEEEDDDDDVINPRGGTTCDTSYQVTHGQRATFLLLFLL